MIDSAEQFRYLRESELADEYQRAAHDEAPLGVWLDVIARMPDLRFWVAHNKTVPLAILEALANDPDDNVRSMVARKRKIPETLQLKLAADTAPTVRSALASNAKLARRVLAMLMEDHEPMVREAARRRAGAAR